MSGDDSNRMMMNTPHDRLSEITVGGLEDRPEARPSSSDLKLGLSTEIQEPG